MIDPPFAVACRIASRMKRLRPIVDLNTSSSSRYICKKVSQPRQLVHVDRDFSTRRKIENQRISSSPVTDAVDGPLARNKGTESVKSRHVVIRYGLLALKRVDLLRVQSSEYKISPSSSRG